MIGNVSYMMMLPIGELTAVFLNGTSYTITIDTLCHALFIQLLHVPISRFTR